MMIEKSKKGHDLRLVFATYVGVTPILPNIKVKEMY